jgi:hypothetical protein
MYIRQRGTASTLDRDAQQGTLDREAQQVTYTERHRGRKTEMRRRIKQTGILGGGTLGKLHEWHRWYVR